ncbi:unnamed protein product [Caenorhabditis auriculariae]|uniref:Uncharacterized protein n=1 Tax=Caenorhabditis auriculariae TaxID=2777116 RepID=A0A8S1HWF0_9PELO|nr:unnamed protein product [Caenorhabditis auriculariae]
MNFAHSASCTNSDVTLSDSHLSRIRCLQSPRRADMPLRDERVSALRSVVHLPKQFVQPSLHVGPSLAYWRLCHRLHELRFRNDQLFEYTSADAQQRWT